MNPAVESTTPSLPPCMGEARPNHKTLVPFKAFLFPYACLSRACLGKPSLFIYSQDKWLAIIMQKGKGRGTFRFAIRTAAAPSQRLAPPFSSPSPAVSAACTQENRPFSAISDVSPEPVLANVRFRMQHGTDCTKGRERFPHFSFALASASFAMTFRDCSSTQRSRSCSTKRNA